MASYFIGDKNQTLPRPPRFLSSGPATSLSSHFLGNLQDCFLFLKHAKFMNTPQLFHLLPLPGTLFCKLSQGCFRFAIRVSAQMSPGQESPSWPLIQSRSHFSLAPLHHIILCNCMSRVYHCEESFLFTYSCTEEIILFFVINVI